MPFYFRKRIRITRNVHLNISKSGVSLSIKRGPVTVNSRGRVTARIARGVRYSRKFW